MEFIFYELRILIKKGANAPNLKPSPINSHQLDNIIMPKIN